MKDAIFYFDMDGTVNEWDLNGDPHSAHYFLYREPITSTIEAIKLLKAMGYNVCFATAVYMNGTAREDKLKWIENNGLSDIPVIFIPYGANKDEYLSGTNKILLDDHTPNLTKFTGKGVKFINRINNQHGTWTGDTVRYDMTGQEIADELLKIAAV